MRFDSARAAGLTEETVDQVEDGFEQQFGDREAAALKLTDLLITKLVPPDDALARELKYHFTAAELVELSLGVGLFLGMSKVLITLGLEPKEMPVTVLPTPGA